MDQDKLWATFQKSGKVEDYLRYCGIDICDAESSVRNTPDGEATNEADHRRTDRAGKQQYR